MASSISADGRLGWTILTQSELKKALLGREKKAQDMKEETWQELDEKALTAFQFYLADKILDEFL